MNRQQRVGLVLIAITTILIMAATTNHYNYMDNFSCGGRLGVGFPVSFLCDYGGSAGSPLNSWGRVDFADFPYFSLQGLLIDSLLYLTVLVAAERLVRRIADAKDLHLLESQKWLALLSVEFLLGYAFASFILAANQENLHNYILGIPPATPVP